MDRILRFVLALAHAIIEDVRIEGDAVVVSVRPHRRLQRMCPVCGRRCDAYDAKPGPRRWRTPGLARARRLLEYRPVRVRCPGHGVRVEGVPWARHGSRLVRGFVRKPIRRLSQGMRQQVCFAMAMVSGAKLMLLDEPMNALDPSNALSASRLLREQCSGGATVLLSTHLLQGLDSLADQVLFLDRGRIAYVRDKDDARPTAEVYADLYLDAMNVGDA